MKSKDQLMVLWGCSYGHVGIILKRAGIRHCGKRGKMLLYDTEECANAQPFKEDGAGKSYLGLGPKARSKNKATAKPAPKATPQTQHLTIAGEKFLLVKIG